jgi:hypothetical protein
MESREEPRADIYKEITNGWNYDTSCMLTLLQVWDLGNFEHLIYVAENFEHFHVCYFKSQCFTFLMCVLYSHK